MQVRDLVADDLAALTRVLDETGLFPSGMLASMAAPWIAGEAEALWLVAERDGQAVGLCHAVPEALTDGTWNLLALAVLPAMQGQGIAARMVGAAEAGLRARGVRMVIIDTAEGEDYAAARRLYERLGYGFEARIRDFWAEGVAKVTFRKLLAGAGEV